MAAAFNSPVTVMDTASEGGAYGAVLVAGVGAGLWANLGEAVKVIHPETEKKEPEMSKESEKAPDQRVSVERRPFSVNSARLGKLFAMLFSLTSSPVNVYCNTCRSVNLTCTEREVGPCAYPPEQEQSFP